MKEVVLGIDIGGTYTKFGVVDKDGDLIKDDFIKTNMYNEFEAYLENLDTVIKDMIQSLSHEIELKAIGIGAPNGNYNRGTIENAPNLVWKGIIPVVDSMKKYFGSIPIVLTNDANAAAIGEMKFGGAKNMKNFIVITLGTGLGSGIVVNGTIVYGHDGFAGELGHVTVYENGRISMDGRKGSLETYVSATGIKRTAFALMADLVVESNLRDIPYSQLNAEMIFNAALKGDKIALEAFDITGKILGRVLSNSVAHLSPEAIFLTGGLANAKDLILNPAIKSFEENLFSVFKNKVKILISELQNKNAAVLGASAMAWKELEEESI